MDSIGATSGNKQGEITTEFIRLNDTKEQLHTRIGILFDRLQSLMRQSEPKTEGQNTVKEMLSSQLAIDLSGVSTTLETDLDKINNIIDRLEI